MHWYKVSKAKLQELEDEVYRLENSLLADEQMQSSLAEARTYEQLQNYSTEQLVHMSNAAEELEEYYRKEDALIREMKELDEGTLIPQLKEKKKQLEETMSLLEKEAKETDAERLARIKVQANVETELKI